MDERRISSLAVVGARGQMGFLFCRLARERGITVFALSRPLSGGQFEQALAECDLALLCVPVTAMRETLELVAPRLAPQAILADICSVKELPLAWMLEAFAGPIAGTHPLFGPNPPQSPTPKVAVVPGRDETAAPAVLDFWRGLGFEAFTTTAEEHDRAMAFVQALNFATTVALLASMRSEPQIERFVTPSFRRRLDSARKMLTEDREMFETISGANPYLQETVRRFRDYLGVAAGGDLDLLAERAAWWFAGRK